MGHTPRSDAPVPAVPAATGARQTSTLPAEVDVLIVGAGLSGINAAYRIQTETNLSYAIAEARADTGGTWSFFKYDGIRSDSDLYTLGFEFSIFRGKDPIADGPAINEYIKRTASDFGIDKKIHLNSKVASASWSTDEGRWSVQIVGPDGTPSHVVKARWAFFNSGYYSYDNPHQAPIPGLHDGTFGGRIIHPQFWDETTDFTGKRVILIGSGATAVTLVPALAEKAEHVTMLQRSPSWYIAMPRFDPIAYVLRFILTERMLHSVLRMKWAITYTLFYYACKAFPNFMAGVLSGLVRLQLGKKKAAELGRPNYKPWDQRLCFIPDGDMFKAMRQNKANVVTDHIETITKTGIKLKSGKELQADIIIPCTGLRMQFFGGAEIFVDGKKVETGDRFFYKGFMLQDVPNLALTIGYTTISWSLGSDVTARYVSRLINRLQETGKDWVKPSAPEGVELKEAPALANLSSGYLQRAAGIIPKAAANSPHWYMRSNWFKDRRDVERDSLTDCLVYGNAKAQ